MQRSKILLAGAGAGVTGPAVMLDGGVWDLPSHSFVEYVIPERTKRKHNKEAVRVYGRVRVFAVVHEDYVGEPIHLDAIQVER